MSFITEENRNELKIFEALKNVIDPELGINVIDMGLVYKIKFDFEKGILIEMTLSTKACPMGNIIREDVENTVRQIFPGIDVIFKLVWEPVWTPEFISPAGKKALGQL